MRGFCLPLDPMEPWGTLTAPGWAAPRCLGAVWPSWEVLRAMIPRTGRVLGSPCPALACGQGSWGHWLLMRGHLVSSWQAEHHSGPPVLRRPVSAAVHLPAVPAHHGPRRTPRAPDAQHQLDQGHSLEQGRRPYGKGAAREGCAIGGASWART